MPDNLPPVPADIPAEVLGRRPDIRSLILKVESASHRAAQAKRNLLPGITLNGSAGTSTRQLEEILNKDHGIWTLGLNITAPVFNGKRLRSAVKVQEASFERSKQELIKGILGAFSEIEQLLQSNESLNIQLDALETAVQQSEDAYTLSKERYDKGVTTLESVLNSQRQYNTIRSQHLTLRRQAIDNRLSLILVLGGDMNSYHTQILN
jgi:multidrug efflux system outer membrane protein